MSKYVIKNSKSEVIEVWEDFFGNLWFTTEILEDGIRFGYARLYHMPEFAEWGTFDIDEIKNAVGRNMVWQVKKKDWPNIDSYEKGLLVEC